MTAAPATPAEPGGLPLPYAAGVKRKDGRYLQLFPGVQGTQRVVTLPEGWLVDVTFTHVPQPHMVTVHGVTVPTLAVGARWLTLVPSTLYGPGGPEDEDQVRCMYNSRLPIKRVEEDNEYEAVVPGGFGGMYVPAVTLYDQL